MHCGKIVRANMAIHMRRHTGERPFKCDLCDKGMSSLFLGLTTVHCYPFILCAAFITQAYVTEHRRVHTGEKAYICKCCGRGFNRATRYAEHMRYNKLSINDHSTMQIYLEFYVSGFTDSMRKIDRTAVRVVIVVSAN